MQGRERHLARRPLPPATQRAQGRLGRHLPVHAGSIRAGDLGGPGTRSALARVCLGAGFPLPWVAGGDSLCSLACLAPNLLLHHILEQLDVPGRLPDGEMCAGCPTEAVDGLSEGALRKRWSNGLRASAHEGLPRRARQSPPRTRKPLSSSSSLFQIEHSPSSLIRMSDTGPAAGG